MTASAACVTPVNSQDETSLLLLGGGSGSSSSSMLQHPWFRKLIDRNGLSSTDWEELQQQKSQLPGLWETAAAAAAASDETSSSSSSVLLVQGQAMVQDMLESQYFCSPSLEFGMTEQTRLVLIPIPSTYNATIHDDEEEETVSEQQQQQHRDKKRLKQQHQQTQQTAAVLGQLYYEQYQQQQQQQQECEMPKLCLNDLVEFVGVWEAVNEEELTPRSNASMDIDDVWMNLNDHHHHDHHPYQNNNNNNLSMMMMWNDEQETNAGSPTARTHKLTRFHILWYRRLGSLEQATNIITMSSSSSTQQPSAVKNDTILHHDIPSILARALHLDSSSSSSSVVAAHAVWMTLLSMAERSSLPGSSSSSGRPITTPHDTTLGCASLHMILQDVTACRALQLQLQHVLSKIVPFVQVMDLSGSGSSSSGSTLFSETIGMLTPPHKQQGRLQPTPLQMPMGSTLILNIGDGDFLLKQHSNNNNSSSNSNNTLLYQALQELTLHHRMPYRFDGGMQLYFEADVRVIVLSTMSAATTTTGLSLLPCTLQVACHFCPHESSGSGCYGEINDNESKNTLLLLLLQQIRIYLAQARCRTGSFVEEHHQAHQHKHNNNNNVHLPQAVLEQAQKDFLERRRQEQQQRPTGNSALVGEEDLHRWLTLTRLQARSRQASEANIDDWHRALELDDAMKETLFSSLL